MLAAQKFNAAKNNPIDSVYGVVTIGTSWRFFRLDGTTVYADDNEIPIETPERIIETPERILGIYVGIIQSFSAMNIPAG